MAQEFKVDAPQVTAQQLSASQAVAKGIQHGFGNFVGVLSLFTAAAAIIADRVPSAAVPSAIFIPAALSAVAMGLYAGYKLYRTRHQDHHATPERITAYWTHVSTALCAVPIAVICAVTPIVIAATTDTPSHPTAVNKNTAQYQSNQLA